MPVNMNNIRRLQLLQGRRSVPHWARVLGVHKNTVANSLHTGKVGLKLALALRRRHGTDLDGWYPIEGDRA